VAATAILLARHGHVEGISPPRFRGHSEIGLTTQGAEQAAALARTIACNPLPTAIYSSPLRRCVMTATAIAEGCNLTLNTLDSLIDIDYGSWQWKTPQEVRADWPELLELWYAAPERVRFPNGDSLQDVALRAADSLRFAHERHRGERIVFVSHDSVIRIMLGQLLGMPLEYYRRIAQDPCALNEVILDDMQVNVRLVNASTERPPV
jgi:phosphoserine phosphatase